MLELFQSPLEGSACHPQIQGGAGLVAIMFLHGPQNNTVCKGRYIKALSLQLKRTVGCFTDIGKFTLMKQVFSLKK